MNKITETTYVTECGDLQNHVSRLTHELSKANEEENLPIHIELEKEYPLNRTDIFLIQVNDIYKFYH